jgi:hypothetical protein
VRFRRRRYRTHFATETLTLDAVWDRLRYCSETFANLINPDLAYPAPNKLLSQLNAQTRRFA